MINTTSSNRGNAVPPLDSTMPAHQSNRQRAEFGTQRHSVEPYTNCDHLRVSSSEGSPLQGCQHKPAANVEPLHQRSTTAIPGSSETSAAVTTPAVSLADSVPALIREIRQDSWTQQLTGQLTLYRDTFTESEKAKADDLIERIERAGAFLDILTLKTLVKWFSDYLTTAGHTSAATEYEQWQKDIDQQVKALINHQHDAIPQKQKRDTTTDLDNLKSLFSSALDQLSDHPYSEAFSDFCRGFNNYRQQFMHKLQNADSVPEDQWSTDDRLLQTAIDTKTVDDNVLSQLITDANHQFEERNYYVVGQKAYAFNAMSIVGRLKNPVDSLKDYIDDSRFDYSNVIEVSNEGGVFPFVELSSVRIDQVNHLLTMGNPWFLPRRMAGSVGNCFASSLLQALSTDFSYYENVFHVLSNSDLSTEPAILAANNLHAAYKVNVLQRQINNKDRLELPEEEVIKFEHKLKMNKAQMVNDGYQLSSRFYKKVLNSVKQLNREVSQLSSVEIVPSNLGHHLITEYQREKQAAQQNSEQPLNQMKLIVSMDYGVGGWHSTIATVKEHPDGRATLYFEDTSTHLTSLTATNLNALSQSTQEFTQRVLESLGKLSLPVPATFEVSKIPDSLIETLKTTQILPNSPLTLGDITQTPFAQLNQLKVTRNLEFNTNFFNKLAQTSVKNTFRFTRINTAPGEGQVSDSDPLYVRMQEVLTAIDDFEQQGRVVPPEVSNLIEGILDDFTRQLTAVNRLSDQQLVNQFNPELVTQTTALAEAMTRFATNSVWEKTLPKAAVNLFKNQSIKYRNRLSSLASQIAAKQSASSEVIKPLTSGERLQTAKSLSKLVTGTKPTASWLSLLCKKPEPDDQHTVADEQELVTNLRDFSTGFFALTGHVPQVEQSTGELSLSDEANLVARYGLNSVQELNPESLLLNPATNPIFAAMEYDPSVKSLLTTLDHYFSDPAIAPPENNEIAGNNNPTEEKKEPQTSQIAIGVGVGAGGAVATGAGVTAFFRRRKPQVGDLRRLLDYTPVRQSVTSGEANAALREIGVDVDVESRPRAPKKTTVQLSDLPDAHQGELPNSNVGKKGKKVSGKKRVAVRCTRSLFGCHTQHINQQQARANKARKSLASRHLKQLKPNSVGKASGLLKAKLLPSTQITFSASRALPSGVMKFLHHFPKIAARVLGYLVDAAAPILTGLEFGLKLNADLEKWFSQRFYEKGITTADDVISWLAMISLPAMLYEAFGEKTTQSNALARIYTWSNGLKKYLEKPDNALIHLEAFTRMLQIDSRPSLDGNYGRIECSDGSVLYRLSFENYQQLLSSNPTNQAFDRFLLGSTSSQRHDVYVITHKAPDGSEVILSIGTLPGILMHQLDIQETKYRAAYRNLEAISRLNHKYVFKTLSLKEELEKVTAHHGPYHRGYVPSHVRQQRIDKIREVKREFPRRKAETEAASRKKMEPIYKLLEAPMESFAYDTRRLQSITQSYFESTDLFNGKNSTQNWQQYRNQHSSFLVPETDPGYHDAQSQVLKAFDQNHERSPAPILTGLEMENFPYKDTAKAEQQKAVLTDYIRLCANAGMDLFRLFPDVRFKINSDAETVHPYNHADDSNITTIGSDLIAVPSILINNRKLDALSPHDFHQITPETLQEINVNKIQADRVRESTHLLHQQKLVYLEVEGKHGHVLVKKSASVYRLLRSLESEHPDPTIAGHWARYPFAIRQQAYRLALEQLSGNSNALPIMNPQQGVLSEPEFHVTFDEDGQSFSEHLFYRDINDNLHTLGSCREDCPVHVNVRLPGIFQSDHSVQLYRVTGNHKTTAVNSVEITYGAQVNKRRLELHDNIIGRYLTTPQRLASVSQTEKHRLVYFPQGATHSVYLASLTYKELTERKGAPNLKLPSPVDASSGGLVLEVTLTGQETPLRIPLQSYDFDQPIRTHQRIKGELPAGDYVLKQDDGGEQDWVYFVVSPDNRQQVKAANHCLTLAPPASQRDVRQAIHHALLQHPTYKRQWNQIFSEAKRHSATSDDAGQTQLVLYQLESGSYRPCRSMELRTGARYFLDNILRLIALCETVPERLSLAQLQALLQNVVTLPRTTMERYVNRFMMRREVPTGAETPMTTNATQASETTAHTSGSFENHLSTFLPENEPETRPVNEPLHFLETLSRSRRDYLPNRASSLQNPLRSISDVLGKALHLPGTLLSLLPGTVLKNRLFPHHPPKTEHPLSFTINVKNWVSGYCSNELKERCTPEQVTTIVTSDHKAGCALLGQEGKETCEQIIRPKLSELQQRQHRERAGQSHLPASVTESAARNEGEELMHQLGTDSLHQWTKESRIITDENLHPLAMPFTKKQPLDSVLNQYQQSHGKLPDSFGHRQGDGEGSGQGKSYAINKDYAFQCDPIHRDCQLLPNTPNPTDLFSAKMDHLMKASVEDATAITYQQLKAAGERAYGMGELLNLLVHSANGRVMVPSTYADAGRMLPANMNDLAPDSLPFHHFIQNSYELMPALVQDISTFIHTLTERSTYSSQWNDQDLLNISILKSLRENIWQSNSLLTPKVITIYLNELFVSPIGPDREREDNVFSVDANEQIRLKDASQGFFSLKENGELQPGHGPCEHFIRAMLMALAAKYVHTVKPRDIDRFMDEPGRQEMLTRLRKLGDIPDRSDLASPLMHSGLKRYALGDDDQTLPARNYLIRFIAQSNALLADYPLSAYDRTMVVDTFWSLMHDHHTPEPDARTAENLKIKELCEKYTMAYQITCDEQPAAMKSTSSELDPGLKREMINTVALQSFQTQLNTPTTDERLPDQIRKVVSDTWQSEMNDYETRPQ